MSTEIDALKHACPMPVLLHRIGLGEFAKNNVRSPFRPDKKPSWGIFQRDGKWFFKDQATGDSGDEITLLARWKGLNEKSDFPQLIKLYADLAGVHLNGEARKSLTAKPGAGQVKSFAWSTCVEAIGPAEIDKLGEWRGYSREFCEFLRAENGIGLHDGNWALPVHGEARAIVACHYRVDRGKGEKPDWFYHPKGFNVRPLILGDSKSAPIGFVFESPWDAFAVMDKLGWHKPKGIPDTAVVITRGASNGKLVVGLFALQTTVYAFRQNDEAKNGKNPADEWLADVCAHARCNVLHVATPTQFKDLNDWTRDGATAADIMAAIQQAKLAHEPPNISDTSGGGENVTSVENFTSTTESLSTLSTLSTAKHKLETAIYPAGSWLDRYMEYARKREESADSYLLGSILPVVTGMLARRVWLPWGDGRVYPNLFVMLAGKPGDRKSSAINLAERVARTVIDKKHFLPDAMSPEALFDEYDEEAGGSPDKLLVVDDANAFLGMMQKTNYGERVGQTLLRLYDCKGLAESFRRNQHDEEGTALRYVKETSTSIALGATFNICQFQGHEIRSGLQRRFLYYLAEGHGRFIAVPAKSDKIEFLHLCEGLAKMSKLQEVEFQFSPLAQELWLKFQTENRERLASEASGPAHEVLLARLNGQPNHVIKLAMCFQAALWGESSNTFTGIVDADTLQTAIDHTEHCLAAAQSLDSIANRAQIQQDADVLLANIIQDFSAKGVNGGIQLTRTELTGKYAHHSGRRGALTPNDLYLRLIPDLIRRSKAFQVTRPGKQSAFIFKTEENNP